MNLIESSYLRYLEERETARKTRAYSKIAMFRDDYEGQVKAKMRPMFSTSTWEYLSKYIDTTDNIMKLVVNEVSSLYIEEPKRDFLDVSDKQKQILETIYKNAKINSKMLVANRYMNVVNDLLFKVVWRNNTVDVDIITPNNVTVIVNEKDFTKPEVIIIEKDLASTDKSLLGKMYEVWTEDNFYLLDGNFNELAAEGNEEMVNPYGILPFVYLHRVYPDSDFWNETDGEDLYYANLYIAMKNTLLNYYYDWNTFKQVAIATGDKLPSGLIVSPDRVLKAPADANIQMLDFQIKLDQLNKAIEDYKKRITMNYGIDLSAFTGKEVSGRALQIKNLRLGRRIKEQKTVLRDFENNLLKMIEMVYFTHTGIKIDAKLKLDFKEGNEYEEAKDVLDIYQKEIDMNLTTAVEIYMKKNPDVGYEDALEKVKENIRLNNELRELEDGKIMEELNK